MPIEDFPPDENGDVLRRMALGGDDLTRLRDIDFSVLFHRELAARNFAASLSREGDRARVAYDELSDPPWEVIVTINMLPTHGGISAFEERLHLRAAPFGGRNEGWGCFAVPK